MDIFGDLARQRARGGNRDGSAFGRSPTAGVGRAGATGSRGLGGNPSVGADWPVVVALSCGSSFRIPSQYLVGMYDVSRERGRLFCAMPHHHDDSSNAQRTAGARTPAAMANATRQACDLHDNGVVRDAVTPVRILLHDCRTRVGFVGALGTSKRALGATTGRPRSASPALIVRSRARSDQPSPCVSRRVLAIGIQPARSSPTTSTSSDEVTS